MNDTVALCPPTFRREGSEGHLASKFQLAIWGAWKEYWREIEKRKKELRAPIYGLAVGDLGDLNKYSKAQLISPVSRIDVERAMLDVAKVAEGIVDEWVIVRGTESHSGASGEMEEWFASDLTNSVPAPDGNASWWVLRAEIEGVRIHATHHPPTGTKLPHKHGQTVARCCEYLASEYNQYGWNEKPHLAFWAHRHWCAPGWEMGIEGWMIPSFKGIGAFGHRIGVTVPNPVGGLICTLENKTWTVEKFLRHPPRLPVWKPGEKTKKVFSLTGLWKDN